jgi:hypothetical protein
VKRLPPMGAMRQALHRPCVSQCLNFFGPCCWRWDDVHIQG